MTAQRCSDFGECWCGKESFVLDKFSAAIRDSSARFSANKVLHADKAADILLASHSVCWQTSLCNIFRTIFHDKLAPLWHGWWQPRDLLRYMGRLTLTTPATARKRLLGVFIVDSLSTYFSEDTVPEEFIDQLEDVGAYPQWWGTDDSIVTEVMLPNLQDVTTLLIEFLLSLSAPALLQPVGPRPGEPQSVKVSSGQSKVLEKVRAMLAKAESTEFVEEAETFTAAAQRLIAKHSIDEAMLAAGKHDPGDKPEFRRLPVDAPYAGRKVDILAAVGSANRCQVIWFNELGSATVTGYQTDIDATEALFTSLLVQVTRAMKAEGNRHTRAGGSRTRTFRESFLQGFTNRIFERLNEQTDDVVATANDRDALLPVLAAREEEVTKTFAEAFPDAYHKNSRVSRYDPEGWAKGTAAGDAANLGGATTAVRG